MNDDEVRLQKHLDEHPDDAASRLILADLLEERGEDVAAYCQRWLAERRLWPDPDLQPFDPPGKWHWWDTPDRPFARRAHAVLPGEVVVHMPRGEWLYSSRIEAENVLAQALARARHLSSSQLEGNGADRNWRWLVGGPS